MKSIAKFLSVLCLFAPAAYAAPVAQTAGSNLTQYNGAAGSVAGNQWNNMTNQRAVAQQNKATADFGNCNAVILRCASPKCANGGCVDVSIARPIVAGCVAANSTCKKHGDALIDSISAQLVSNSVAAQQAAQQNAQMAAAQAQAEASQQNAQQIAEMQQQMQMQMQAMQEQNNAQIASLQSALVESQQATADAIAAAAESANQRTAASGLSPNSDTGLTVAQEVAAKSGVSEEIITRKTITGEILTSMDSVDDSLKQLRTTMRDAFRYGKCNEINGDNCKGPKRVAKFRELATKFFDPYDSLVENLDSALTRARLAGVEMTDIYMMLSGSCNRWGEFLCSAGSDTYSENENDPAGYCDKKTGLSHSGTRVKNSGESCIPSQLIPVENDRTCILNKEIGEEQVKESWLYTEEETGNKIRIGCASSVLDGSVLARRRSAGKKSGISIDILEHLITQDAPESFGKDNVADEIKKYCHGNKQTIRDATISKTLPVDKMCCDSPAAQCDKKCTEESAYVSPAYAICDVHVYNAGITTNGDLKTSKDKAEVEEYIKLKTTVIAQQMYKQYTMLESMITRLKMLLEKATLKASLQVAGGSSSSDDDSDSSNTVSFENCGIKSDALDVVNCLRANYAKYDEFVEKGRRVTYVRQAMEKDCKALEIWLEKIGRCALNTNCNFKTGMKDKAGMEACYAELATGINELSKKIKEEDRDKKLMETYFYGKR